MRVNKPIVCNGAPPHGHVHNISMSVREGHEKEMADVSLSMTSPSGCGQCWGSTAGGVVQWIVSLVNDRRKLSKFKAKIQEEMSL